jgi:predicted permease
MRTRVARLHRLVLRCYPDHFRREFGDAMLDAMLADHDAAWRARGRAGAVAQFRRSAWDAIRHGLAERAAGWRGRRPGLAVIDPAGRLASPRAQDRPSSRRPPMLTILQDARLALRSLRHAPGFTFATVATIALGSGAVIAMGAAVYGVVLRPLPFEGSTRVVKLCETHARLQGICVASAVNVADWAAQSDRLELAGVARQEQFALLDDGRAVGLRGAVASAGFLRVLSARLVAGRHLEDADLAAGAAPVALVSHGFWTTRLGSDPEAAGRHVTLDGRVVRVIGVLAPDLYVPGFPGIDVWKPLTASVDDVSRREWRGFIAYARMRPGATLADVRAELEVIRGSLTRAYPVENADWGVHVVGLRDDVAGPAAPTLWLLLSAAVVLGLVAAANVASLVTVRTTRRAREFAVRAALGAGWPRLAWPLFVESLAISLTGCAIGLLAASAAIRSLIRMAPPGLPRVSEVSVDAAVVAGTMGASLLAAFLFAAVALIRSRHRGRDAMAGGWRVAGADARAAVVVAQTALAVVLVLGAGLIARGLLRVMAWEPGFERHGVRAAWLLASPDAHGTTAAAAAALGRMRDAVATVPGVVAAGLGSAGPLFGGTETDTAIVASGDRRGQETTARWYDVDEGYFAALGRPIRRGRGVTAADVQGAPGVVVINETLASRLFGERDPLGQQLTIGSRPALTIVGVAADVRPAHPDAPVEAEVFWPLRQFPRFGAYLVVRAAPDAVVEPSIRAAIDRTGVEVQAGALRSIDALFDRTLQAPWFGALLVGGFATSALGLAFFGLYAVVAYTVSRRTRELGVRIALGATPGQLLRSLVLQGVRLSSWGVAIGLVLGFVASRAVIGLVPGLVAPDVVTVVAVAGGMLVLTLVATVLPAQRVTAIDPVRALGAE